MIQTSRRSLITGLVSFLAAPAVVRAASLMPLHGYFLRGDTAASLWVSGVAEGGHRVCEYVERGVNTLTRWRSIDDVSFSISPDEIKMINEIIPNRYDGSRSSVVSLHP